MTWRLPFHYLLQQGVGEGVTSFPGSLHFLLIRTLYCWVLIKAVSSTIFESLVWLNLRLNCSLLDQSLPISAFAKDTISGNLCTLSSYCWFVIKRFMNGNKFTSKDPFSFIHPLKFYKHLGGLIDHFEKQLKLWLLSYCFLFVCLFVCLFGFFVSFCFILLFLTRCMVLFIYSFFF